MPGVSRQALSVAAFPSPLPLQRNGGSSPACNDRGFPARLSVKAALDAKYWLARRLLGLLDGTIRLFQGNQPATPILYLAVNLFNSAI